MRGIETRSEANAMRLILQPSFKKFASYQHSGQNRDTDKHTV